MQLPKLRNAVPLATVAAGAVAVSAWIMQDSKAQEPAKTATPADGYTVHVTAPHMVNGHEMGPYHHYCKVIAPDPQIVSQI